MSAKVFMTKHLQTQFSQPENQRSAGQFEINSHLGWQKSQRFEESTTSSLITVAHTSCMQETLLSIYMFREFILYNTFLNLFNVSQN